TYTAADLVAFNRVMAARMNYLDFSTPQKVIATAFPSGIDHTRSPGFCQALDEGMRSMSVYHVFFNGNFPLESSYGDSIRYIDRMIEDSRGTCRLTVMRDYWQNRN